MKRLFLVIIVCFVGFMRVKSENIQFYDSKQLTCDLITSICQDKDGFIWIGTDYGLNRFNGIQFTHYYNNPGDSTSLLDNSVRVLKVDSEGVLWVGSVSGLQYYVPEENAFRCVEFDGVALLHVKGITQMRSGDIWIASSGQGLFCIRKGEKKARQITNIPGTSGYLHYGSVYEDREGIIWIGIDDVGLLRYNPITQKTSMYKRTDLKGGSTISGMSEDLSGNFLVTTTTAAYHYNRSNEQFTEIAHEESWLPMRSILTSTDGTCYMTTYGKGLKVLQPDLSTLRSESVVLPAFELSNEKIPAIYEDKDRNLWLGCYHKGVVMVSKEPTSFQFWSIPHRELPTAGVITTLGKDSHENTIGGIENCGIFKVNSKGEIVQQMFEGKTFSSVYKDYKGNIWYGGRFGGSYMEDIKGNISLLFPDLKLKDIKKITGDEEDNLYISVYGSGFFQYHIPTRTITDYQSSSSKLKNNWVNSFLYSSKNLLWIGHCYGIDCLDPQTKKFKPRSDKFANFITYALLEDVKGNIWGGTNKGLICYNPQNGTFKQYDMEDGLSNNLVYGLAEDERGNIWCSTLKGINQIDVKENRIASYYSERGLVDNEYIREAYYQSMDGTIYFGGIKGITSFHPDSIVQQKKHLRVTLTNIYLGGQPVTAKQQSGGRSVIDAIVTQAEQIHFAYEDNTFTLEFSTFDYKNAENIFYEYRIKEYGKAWTATLPGVNQITYNHLSPGSYTFEVRACENGQYSPVKVIHVHIAPPWWRSIPAYIFYMLLLVIVFVQIYFMLRRRQQKALNEEKIKLFINLAHEIRSPMTLIVSPLENLLKRDYDQETTKLLRLMHKNANRIINLMNQLLDMRKIEKGQMRIHCAETELVEFIQELVSLFDYQAQKRNINLHFEYEQNELFAWVDRNNFDKVLVNLLTNAFKFTPDQGEIKIGLRERFDERAAGELHHFVEIEITDSGTGIDANKLEKIFERFYQAPNSSHGSLGFGIGLNLCRLIVKLHHGTIKAYNRTDGQGSSFVIRLPFGKEHLKKNELTDADTELKQIVIAPAIDLNFTDEDNEGMVKAGKYHKTNYKIVIVDDDSEIRDFLQAELGQQHKVYVCQNGKEGLQAILKYQPDLVISDVIMPEMDGISLLKALRANSSISHIPVILLTSKTDYQDRMQGLSKGADVFLNKPFNVEELKIHIKRLIEMRLLLKGKFSGAQDQEGKIEIQENKSGDERLMERVMNVMNKYISEPEFNVEMLAREVGLSRVQLHRKLKDITGVPASTFIRNLRMKKAATLLRERKLNISEVANEVGFDNQGNFSTVFKKFYGVAPTEYIESTKNSGSSFENNGD